MNFNDKALIYCEDHGIYQPWSLKGNMLTYYTYFPMEGMYKAVVNIKTGKEKRKLLRYKKIPAFLKSENGTLYCYMI